MYVCIYIHTYIYVYVCIHIYVCVCVCIYERDFSCLFPSPSFFHPPNPLPSDSCQPVSCDHASISNLFISLFCSLDFLKRQVVSL